MPVQLSAKAIEEGTFAITVAFTDEDGEAVAPDVLTWTLVDLIGNIINSREDVVVANPESTETIVLTGDDLSVTNRFQRGRVLIVEGTYTSTLGAGLPIRESVSFTIADIIEPGEVTVPIGLSLLGIRRWFVRSVGRYDFIHADGSDNGADLYINAGLRLIDSLSNAPKQWARNIATIAEGDFTAKVQYCKSIEEVWVADSDGRTMLERVRLQMLREEYSSPESDIDTGQPLYWDEDAIGLAPAQSALTSSDFTDMHDYGSIMFGDHHSYTGIYFMPPSDGTYTMDIYGRFYQKTMSDDNDRNFWSTMHPHSLVRAAAYALEVDYRNRAGAQAELDNLAIMLKGINSDKVAQEIAGINQMEG